jgi:hypothetical protein
VFGAALVSDGRRAQGEESTRALHEECAHVGGPRGGSVSSWPRLAPPHAAPGYSEMAGPPPPPKPFLALVLPLLLPPAALAMLMGLVSAPSAVDAVHCPGRRSLSLPTYD